MRPVTSAVEWAESHWVIPGTRTLIRLRAWERAAKLAMFSPDGTWSPWETFLISTVKKAGKTTLNAIAVVYAALTFPAPETCFVVANDEAQAQERVFDLIVKQVRAMGLERTGAAVITKGKVLFPETGTRVVTIPADLTDDRLLTAKEVAELLSVPVRWVREHTRSGLVPHVQLGRYVRYDRADVLAWVAEQKSGGAAWRRHRPVHAGGTK